MTPSTSGGNTEQADCGKFGRIASGNHLVAQNDEPDAAEQARINADLAYNAEKASGALDSRRIEAAHDAELRELVASGRLK